MSTAQSVLVVGGAGYIGSHMVKYLVESGHRVTVLDNLSSGHRDAVQGAYLIEGDLADTVLLDKVFAAYRFDTVMHFASFIQVGESVKKPDIYYQNNVSNTLSLLNAMVRHAVKHLVFSSTAAIFGEPEAIPINEHHPKHPLNPYGRSKWMMEQILADYDHAYGLKSACLRYFNAAGADPSGRLGERHDPETHLIPIALEVALGKRKQLSVYGTDYTTPDGTCIRDYIHVNDLCQAHQLAMEYLHCHQQSIAVNLGNGQGFSVQEVINTVQQVTGITLDIVYGERRDGDPAQLIADSQLARELLGWKPVYPALVDIVAHAWRWAQQSSDIETQQWSRVGQQDHPHELAALNA